MSATITQDETIRTVTVDGHDPGFEDLSEDYVKLVAAAHIIEEDGLPPKWTVLDVERIRYNRAIVRFQKL